MVKIEIQLESHSHLKCMRSRKSHFLMLAYRPRRWPNIKTTLDQYLVFAGTGTACLTRLDKMDN